MTKAKILVKSSSTNNTINLYTNFNGVEDGINITLSPGHCNDIENFGEGKNINFSA